MTTEAAGAGATAVPLGDNVHGEQGVYNAGEWVPIEDCAKLCEGCACAPSAEAQSSTDEFDVVVVGAGCVGSSVARELSKHKLKVALLESADDVTQGATKANSGIVHAGYDDKPGSIRAQFCWRGNQMYPQLDKDLHFGFKKSGSLVVAFGTEQEKLLDELMERGRKNEVANLRIIDQAELRDKEPNIHPDATKALYSPDAGIVTPYEFTIAVAENAADNGVDIRVNTRVTAISKPSDDSKLFQLETESSSKPPGFGFDFAVSVTMCLMAMGCALLMDPIRIPYVALAATLAFFTYARHFLVATPVKKTVKARYVVNAAGLKGDEVAAMIGDTSFKIKPRIGEYLLLKKEQGRLVRSVLFPCPTSMGKGVVVQPVSCLSFVIPSLNVK